MLQKSFSVRSLCGSASMVSVKCIRRRITLGRNRRQLRCHLYSSSGSRGQILQHSSLSRAHARGYSAVLSSLLFFRHLVGLARSSTESSTRLRFGSNFPHPRSRAIVLPVSTFHHRQASLLPLTYRAKVSLQRTLYSATFQLSGIYISSTRCLTVTEVQRVGILQQHGAARLVRILQRAVNSLNAPSRSTLHH